MAHVQKSKNERLGPGAQDPGQGLREIDDRAKNTTERSREALHEGKEKVGEGADRTARAAQRGGEKASEAVSEGAEKAGEGVSKASGAAKEGGANFSEGAKNAAGNAASNFGENIKNFASQAKDAAGDAAKIAGDETKKVASNVQENSKAAGDQLKEGAGRAKEAAADTGAKAKESAQKTADRTSYESRDTKYSVESVTGKAGDASRYDAGGKSAADEQTESLEGDYEIVKSVAGDDKEIDAEKSKDDIGSFDQHTSSTDSADTGKVTFDYREETTISRSGEGGEKTKDALPLQSTTVGKEMKDNANQTFTGVKSQPVYTADDSSKPSHSTGAGATGRGFGVAGRDVDLKVKDTDYKPDQAAYPAEYGAADDQFVTRTTYKEEGKNDEGKNDEEHEKSTDDEPGTLVALTQKIAENSVVHVYAEIMAGTEAEAGFPGGAP
ncbi:hypothetical protein R1sor_004850 [Riccia sorocarpa]|uniref:Uncharacterized protein n=1 Tax=Riccia sorocarpa TaxID=122646 RepID=A0ABD3HLE2_9MARC